MAKKKTNTDTPVKSGGGKNLVKDCSKIIIISTLIIIVLGLGILTLKKKDQMKSSPPTQKKIPDKKLETARAHQQKTDPQATFNLQEEIKKLEARQAQNFSKLRSNTGDPLAD